MQSLFPSPLPIYLYLSSDLGSHLRNNIIYIAPQLYCFLIISPLPPIAPHSSSLISTSSLLGQHNSMSLIHSIILFYHASQHVHNHGKKIREHNLCSPTLIEILSVNFMLFLHGFLLLRTQSVLSLDTHESDVGSYLTWNMVLPENCSKGHNRTRMYSVCRIPRTRLHC